MKAVIIGSGVSGLTAALYLARAGWEVRIFEQFEAAGGVTAGFSRNGFQWDLGQLIVEGFGPGDQVGLILSELGLDRAIDLVPADRVYRFPDFQVAPEPEFRGAFWRRDFLKKLFPEDSAGLDRYYRLYTRMVEIFSLARDLERARFPRSLFKKIRLYTKLLPILPMAKKNAAEVAAKYFSNPRLRAVFLSILADFVVLPTEFPGAGIPAVNPEPAFDRRVPRKISATGFQPAYHFIRGGTRALVDAFLTAIQAHGGSIVTGVSIDKIEIEGSRAIGVRHGGFLERADVVIATGSARETFTNLVDASYLKEDFLRTVRELPLMESVLLLELAVDFDPVPLMGHPVVYYYQNYDFEGAIARLKSGEYHEGRDGFVMCVPSAFSPELAPPGCAAVTLYTVAPNQLRQGTWGTRRAELADKLVAQAEQYVPGLRSHIIDREIFTPEDYRRRVQVAHHSFGGLSPVMGKSGIPHKTPVAGLWYAGAQSQSGAGMNNVIAGGWRVAREILKTKNRPRG